MQQTGLDESNALIGEIATLLIASEDLTGEWDAVALGVILDGTNYDASGFLYKPNGKIVPIAPEEEEIYNKLIAYRDFQAQQSGNPVFKACLIQMERASASFEIIAEYDNPMRWKITPSNLKEMRASLRP